MSIKGCCKAKGRTDCDIIKQMVEDFITATDERGE